MPTTNEFKAERIFTNLFTRFTVLLHTQTHPTSELCLQWEIRVATCYLRYLLFLSKVHVLPSGPWSLTGRPTHVKLIIFWLLVGVGQRGSLPGEHKEKEREISGCIHPHTPHTRCILTLRALRLLCLSTKATIHLKALCLPSVQVFVPPILSIWV